MSNNDQLIDTPELRELRDSMSGVALPERPRLEAITAKGRGRRRRRLAGVPVVSAVAAAAVVTLSLGLPGVHSRARTPGTIRTLGMIRTAAFTIHANPSGTATLTINPKELLNPAALQSDLARYGIPAKVTVGSFCSSDPTPAGFSRVVSFQRAGGQRSGESQVRRLPLASGGSDAPKTGPPSSSSTAYLRVGGTVRAQVGSAHPALTIDPAAMPTGTELSVGDFQLATGQQQASFALINTSSYTCTNTPPNATELPDGGQLLYGGPGAS
ncbi:MAG: hypothetical protein ACLP0L_08780 [Solirubrobacteraceae bacterium]